MTTDASVDRRTPLSRERVLHAAISLADRQGFEALTMRRLAEDLDVEAMSLYYHVANKEALLDGIVETIVTEIEEEVGGFDVPPVGDEWKAVLRSRILGARTVLLRHPWAPAVIETRTTMLPTIVRYMDSLLGLLREGGFSYDIGHHAMHALGSRALGFSQELFQPATADEEVANSEMLHEFSQQFPYITAMLAEVAHDDPDSTLGWCDDQSEFEFGLDLILDGLERLRDR